MLIIQIYYCTFFLLYLVLEFLFSSKHEFGFSCIQNISYQMIRCKDSFILFFEHINDNNSHVFYIFPSILYCKHFFCNILDNISSPTITLQMNMFNKIYKIKFHLCCLVFKVGITTYYYYCCCSTTINTIKSDNYC